MRSFILILLLCVVAEAQSIRNRTLSELVELGRVERERREARPASRVYTTEDLRRFAPAPVAAETARPADAPDLTVDEAAEGGDSAEDTLPAASGPEPAPVFLSEQDWVDWEESLAAQQRRIADLERREASQQQLIDEMRESGSGVGLGAAERGMGLLREELEAARARLVELEASPPDVVH